MSTEKLIEAATLVEQHGSITAAAEATGIPRTTLSGRYKKAKSQGHTGADECVVSPDGQDKATIITHGPNIRTVEDAIQRADIDLRIWEVDRSVVNAWTTTIKNAENKPEQITNWQVKAFLRRKAPKPFQNSIMELCDEFSSSRSKVAKVKRKPTTAPHMLELSLYDAHFGKLCWGQETGTDYDLKIAEQVFLNAIDELLSLSSGFQFDKILFPVGHDFFQANNWASTTAKGTIVDSTDDRMQRVFHVGARTLTRTIERCLDVAPVEVLWVPGNHDPETSWYLVEWLSAYFRNHDDATFDTSPAFRKYRTYGDCLIGFTHGNEERHDSLPLVMASEHPGWSASKHREVHVGHFHKKKETKHNALDEFEGTRVRILPSLSGTDSWHFRKGYVKNKRAAECHIWSPTNGHVGQFSSNVA